MPKYVVSATLESVDEWDHTTVIGYDDIEFAASSTAAPSMRHFHNWPAIVSSVTRWRL